MRPLIPSFWLGVQQAPPNFNKSGTIPLGRLWLLRPTDGQIGRSARLGDPYLR